MRPHDQLRLIVIGAENARQSLKRLATIVEKLDDANLEELYAFATADERAHFDSIMVVLQDAMISELAWLRDLSEARRRAVNA
jgi:hypothetical protein